MPIVLLVRHGHSTANAEGVLSGRMPGVSLTERGVTEARAAADALAATPLARIVSSPMERCLATAEAIAGAQAVTASPTPPDPSASPVPGSSPDRPVGWVPPAVETDDRLVECGYGAWTGRALKDLVSEPLWRTVQSQPSAARFPDAEAYAAESLAEVSARAVAAVRALDAEVEARHGADAVWAAVSHGDVIKAILADAAGVHLDQFQRFVVEPGSVAAVRYTAYRPFLLGVNTDPARMAALVRSTGHRADGEATPGGTAQEAPPEAPEAPEARTVSEATAS
ncbi:Phosphoglycerate mutase [Nostocoides japonicum T1-X7]|uniref:Phosphoglycerate mutase n=1 Tax=Nostocoides japonicum T1-X7 TaxID=1194083 RepID=A0A077LWJ9_9MICO|nr:histidine phosphatase family protein [Tetrasphaera japonica]CCH76394.1 Phosphoglycerate mutase [Tetrasphaera japonica T1-X7]